MNGKMIENDYSDTARRLHEAAEHEAQGSESRPGTDEVHEADTLGRMRTAFQRWRDRSMTLLVTTRVLERTSAIATIVVAVWEVSK